MHINEAEGRFDDAPREAARFPPPKKNIIIICIIIVYVSLYIYIYIHTCIHMNEASRPRENIVGVNMALA